MAVPEMCSDYLFLLTCNSPVSKSVRTRAWRNTIEKRLTQEGRGKTGSSSGKKNYTAEQREGNGLWEQHKRLAWDIQGHGALIPCSQSD